MKLTITAEQAAKLAAREGDLDPTTGRPDYIPGFVPSLADRYYERKLAALHAQLATYEEILRVVCGHLELPQSESGPADDVRLYDRALEAADEYTKRADADLAVNRDARFKAEAEVVRLRAERTELRFKVTAAKLTDQQLADEMAEMQRAFSSRGEHGGSPGEWSYERMGEIATEQQRRTPIKTSGNEKGGQHG